MPLSLVPFKYLIRRSTALPCGALGSWQNHAHWYVAYPYQGEYPFQDNLISSLILGEILVELGLSKVFFVVATFWADVSWCYRGSRRKFSRVWVSHSVPQFQKIDHVVHGITAKHEPCPSARQAIYFLYVVCYFPNIDQFCILGSILGYTFHLAVLNREQRQGIRRCGNVSI